MQRVHGAWCTAHYRLNANIFVNVISFVIELMKRGLMGVWFPAAARGGAAGDAARSRTYLHINLLLAQSFTLRDLKAIRPRSSFAPIHCISEHFLIFT